MVDPSDDDLIGYGRFKNARKLNVTRHPAVVGVFTNN